MTLPLLITPEADSQIREIDAWWRKNRAAAPNLFLDELNDALILISALPRVGRLYRRSPVNNVRRFLLQGARYHLYYVALEAQVWLLAVWHAQRGVGPPLRQS